ncbi:MAG: TonB-dependent receptor [Pseudomonadota bacterium]
MSRSHKHTLFLTLLGLATSYPAQAQTGVETSSPVAAPPGIDEIIVRAQRRDQALEDVPISVTVFDAERIDRDNITQFEDIAILTPNLGINDGSRQGEATVSIRGIGSLGGEQPTFGLYLDGFELANTTNRIYDVERVEVLRGPQGTQFGRNVIAGAINFTSVTPDREGRNGYLSFIGGNYDHIDLEGAASFPIGEATALRIAGFYQDDGGFLENEVPSGTRSNGFTRAGGRITVASTPTDRLTLKGILSYEEFESDLPQIGVTDGVLIGQLPAFQQIMDLGLGAFPPGTLPAGASRRFDDTNTAVALDTPSFGDRDTLFAIGRAEYEFDSTLLTLIVGGLTEDRDARIDQDLSEFDAGFSTSERSLDQWSAELRFGSKDDSELVWVTGLYYTDESADGRAEVISGGDLEALTLLPSAVTGFPNDFSLLPNNSLLNGNSFTDESQNFAAYADIDYAITDQLNLLAGLRYSSFDVEESVSDGVDLVDLGGGILGIAPIPDAEDSRSADATTWRFSAVYAATDNLNFYTTVSSGFRPGGLQLNNIEASDFDEEELINYEIGTKSFFFDRRLSLNISAFRMEWDDIQINVTDQNTNATFTDNAAEAVAKGAELEFLARPTERLTLSGGIGYVDTELSDFDDPEDDRIGAELPNAPQWTTNVAADYVHPLSNGYQGFLRVVYVYNDRQSPGLLAPGAENALIIDSYERWDLRLGIIDPGQWRLELYAENLLDDIYATGAALSGFSFSGSTYISEPRRYGLRFRYEFE